MEDEGKVQANTDKAKALASTDAVAKAFEEASQSDNEQVAKVRCDKPSRATVCWLALNSHAQRLSCVHTSVCVCAFHCILWMTADCPK